MFVSSTKAHCYTNSSTTRKKRKAANVITEYSTMSTNQNGIYNRSHIMTDMFEALNQPINGISEEMRNALKHLHALKQSQCLLLNGMQLKVSHIETTIEKQREEVNRLENQMSSNSNSARPDLLINNISSGSDADTKHLIVVEEDLAKTVLMLDGVYDMEVADEALTVSTKNDNDHSEQAR